jgi:beta-mannosidase
VLQPVALLATDEGLNGLHLHVVNDGAERVVGSIEISLFDAAGRRSEQATVPVEVPGRDGVELSADAAFEGFRDLTYAYRFGPPAYDVIHAVLRDEAGAALGEVVHLVGGPARAVVPTIGLRARVAGSAVEVATDLLAQHVVIEAPGFVAADSWFHLPPGATRVVELTGEGAIAGEVRALNTLETVRL